jgi:hypothetical protein
VIELPFDLSPRRISRIAVLLGVIGMAVVSLAINPRDGLGFGIGAVLSVVTIRSWFKLASNLGADGGLPGGGAAVFLVLRYVLIAAAIYVTIKYLGSNPALVVAGLLVSFAAILIDLGIALTSPKISK